MAATGEQISTSVSIINSLDGLESISLTNMNDASAPDIPAGCVVEIAGAFFGFSSAATPQATTWTAITTGATAFVTLSPSGSAGTQIVTAKWSDTAPEWIPSKGAYYLSGASTIRYIAGCRKEGATSYYKKFILDPHQTKAAYATLYESDETFASREQIAESTYKIGEWDMNTNQSKGVTCFIPGSAVVAISGLIRNDAGNTWLTLFGAQPGGEQHGSAYIDDSLNRIIVQRVTGGQFDSAFYESTAGTVANRGYVTVRYFV